MLDQPLWNPESTQSAPGVESSRSAQQGEHGATMNVGLEGFNKSPPESVTGT